MRLLGNLIWFVFGGFIMGLAWWAAAVLTAITIVGIPFAIAAFRIGTLSFWPFGREVADSPSGGETSKVFVLLGNVIWILLGGLWLAIGHVFWALLFAITIIGLPFAVQHIKLARLSLMPFGTVIVVSPS
jgi:uncharacterized membrane protein YccF (DUF307 family)